MKWSTESEDLLSGKTEGEVFEKATYEALYKLMSRGAIEVFDFPISTGKEGNVFRARNRDGYVAVKIYRLNTSTFRNISKYLEYDRLSSVKKNRRGAIFAWANKEFRNLERLCEAGVRVPGPVAHHGNVIVMEYIGSETTPAPMLKDAELEAPEETFDAIVADMSRMYHDAGLVHADLSEYNVLYHAGPVIIDVGQMVKREHPMVQGFLEHDVDTLSRFFSRFFPVDRDEMLQRILEEKT
ncbi:MAG: serine protein kinase RIO [Thermoplasmatota archaeon]